MLQKCYQHRLIPLAFVALVLENELQYHGLAVRVNSRDDGATSSKNLVNFCLVTPEMTGLICVRLVRPKTGVYSLISPDGDIRWRLYTGPIFAIFTPYESAVRADDESVPYFPICWWTLPLQPNNIAIMKENWYYVHCLHVCQMLAWFLFATAC